MAFQTKKTRVAIKKETTEGTLVLPTASTDYLAIQDDFTLDLAQSTVENPELKASIGASKSFTGFEEPSGSISHVLRHSGTEGVQPQAGYQALLEAAYGSVSLHGTERTTTAGSTTTSIVLDTGFGADFAIGEALLIKHASNPWEIVVIADLSGDTVTPLFALNNAPASGVSVGKAVSYVAADEGHPSLSIVDYRANGGAIQAVAGARVTAMSVTVTAGEILNANYSIEGIKNFYNPIEVQAGVNDALDFDDGGGEENATITAQVYASPIALAEEIEKQMNALTTDVITVTYSSSTGKYTIETDGVSLSLLWNTGTNTATTIGDTIGFDTAADDSASTSYIGDNAIDLTSPQTPSFDSQDALVARNNRIMVGTQTDNVCFSTNNFTYSLGTPKTDELSICEETGKAGSIINERTVEVSLVANLPQYDAAKFDAFKNNTAVSFQYNFGTKTAGDWDAGSSGCLHIKDASITQHSLTDTDGLVTLELTLVGYVDNSANPETALNLL